MALGSQRNLIAEFLDHRTAQREMGYLFPLAASSLGGKTGWEMRVRRIPLIDRASLNMLPQHVQETVWQGMKALREAQKLSEDQGEPESLMEFIRDNEQVARTARIFCEASFLALRQGDQEVELTGPAAKTVLDAISAEDQLAFLVASQDAESAQAKRLKLFRPTAVVDVPAREAEPVATAPERPAGPGDGGLQPVRAFGL